MKKPPAPQLTLDQVSTYGGLPASKAYGMDHAPKFPEAEANRLYLDATTILERGASELDGLQLLAILAAIENATALAEPPQRVGTAAVELAQALLLRFPFEGRPIGSPQVREFIDALSTDMHLFLNQTAKPPTDEKGELLSRRRLQTLMVRHTYYPHHASQVFRRIGGELTSVGHQAFGMSLGQASLVTMGAAYFVAAMLENSDIPTAVLQWVDAGTAAFDPSWIDLFEIQPQLLAMGMSGIPTDRIAQLLDRLSHTPGELASANPAHLHLDNPVWRKPFVKTGERWYCFSPGTLLASQADIMAELAGDISGRAGELLGKARGDALEDMAAETLGELFPHGQLLRSVFWRNAADEEHETDAIVLIDGLVLIFEAKGDALSLVSRRGSQKWLRDFDDIVVKASCQAWQLEQILRDHSQPTIELKTASGAITLDKTEIRHIVRFGVSLERVTMASFGMEDHLRERIRRAGAEAMPIFTIGDLWQVRDLVGSEGRCLHFFLRRAELERDYDFLGDELDLLAHYLRTGFIRLWRITGERRAVSVYGLSDFLRHYQKGTPHHQAGLAPPKRTTRWWDQIIQEQEDRQRRGWTDMVYDLLNIPLVSQERFQDDINTMRRKIRRVRGKQPHDGVLMQAPEQLRPSALACIVAGKMTTNERIGAARASQNSLKTIPTSDCSSSASTRRGNAASPPFPITAASPGTAKSRQSPLSVTKFRRNCISNSSLRTYPRRPVADQRPVLRQRGALICE